MTTTSIPTTPQALPTIDLAGLTVAVDVQHLYRDGIHAQDRGTIYALEGGGKVAEADCALHYAQALADQLRSAGAAVIVNSPRAAVLVGPYSRRQWQAANLGAQVYLACHLNAGGGSYALTEVTSELSMPLARAILLELALRIPEIKATKAKPLATGDRGAVCVRGFTRGPAVLLEPLFGDFPAHQRLLSLAGLDLIGRTIARGVATWYAGGRA